MNRHFVTCILVFTVSYLCMQSNALDRLPENDLRLSKLSHNRIYFTFPEFESKREWLERKAELDDLLRVSMGSFPWIEKTPLNPVAMKSEEGEGFIVENVYFESMPGLFVTGNLYHPAEGEGPFPAILCPHGHWGEGRLVNDDNNSVPARCIQFARMGMIAFAIDMIGYVDAHQLGHGFGGKNEWLWGLSVHGLQYWNSVRSIDYLLSRDDVDPERIGCTGASGGGTQTFVLAALDERIKVSAPVNMLSAHFQGGCLCENAPSMRLNAFNLEFGAMAAPNPLLMVSASGDWTDETLRIEYPAVRSVFLQYNAADHIHSVQVDAPHNYNRQSREHVYQWFNQWFLDGEAPSTDEGLFELDLNRLRMFPNGESDLPESARSAEEITSDWIDRSEAQLQQVFPSTDIHLRTMKRRAQTALKHAMGAVVPDPEDLIVERINREKNDERMIESIAFGRAAAGDRIEAVFVWPRAGANVKKTTLLVDENGMHAMSPISENPLISALSEEGLAVLVISPFATGDGVDLDTPARDEDSVAHFHTYNPSDDAMRVQDIITSLVYLDSRTDVGEIRLAGRGEAGLWCLLAAAVCPLADSYAIDADGFDIDSDDAYLERLFVPHIRRAGDLRVAQAALAPKPALIHNIGEDFSVDWAKAAYKSMVSNENLKTMPERASDEEWIAWLAGN